MNQPAARRLFRFSVFEADLDSGELFKKGQKVKLQEQPFEVLVELLKNPGSLVTREHLKDQLWPGDTAGEFDSSLNRAINRIREVLGDSAESPRFIETLPRRGYRFIATVSDPNAVEPAPAAVPIEVHTTARQPPPARKDLRVAVAGSAVAAVLLVTWLALHRGPIPPEDPRMRKLTTNSSENPVSNAVISPDGNYLALGDSTGILLQEISSGQRHSIPRPPPLSEEDGWFPSDWFPDGARMVASAITTTPDGQVVVSAWSAPVLGKPVLLRNDAMAASVSPDGSLIAFTRGLSTKGALRVFDFPWAREIWVMGPNGENARKLYASDGALLGPVQWLPDNSRLAFEVSQPDSNGVWKIDIETLPLTGGRPRVILSDFAGLEFRWIADGRIIYSCPEAAPKNGDTNLWEQRVNQRTGKPEGGPLRLTRLPGFQMRHISVSADGKKLTVQKTSYRNDTYIGRLQADGQLAGQRRLTSDESANLPWAWTTDSKAVIFTSDRTGVNAIYKQEIDQNLAELIPTGAESVWLPRVTPDGSFIVYFAQSDIQYPWRSRATHLMRVPVSGGAREMLLEFPVPTYQNLDCPVLPNTRCIIEKGPTGGKPATLISFDPLTGECRELFKRSVYDTNGFQWTISPDGTHLGELHKNSVLILSLEGKVERTIYIKGWPYLSTIDWTGDGKALLVSHDGPNRATLLRVRLDGQIRPLWEMKNFVSTWAVASPDGNKLAFMGGSLNSNVWLLEGF